MRRAWSIFWKTITKWHINIPYLLTLELQSATQLRRNLLSDLIVKGVRPWVIAAALKCAATATKYFHSEPSVCPLKTTQKYWNYGLRILRVWPLNHRLAVRKFKSTFIHFSQQSFSILSKFPGALWKYLVRLKLHQKVCDSSDRLGGKHHSLSHNHLVFSMVCT